MVEVEVEIGPFEFPRIGLLGMLAVVFEFGFRAGILGGGRPGFDRVRRRGFEVGLEVLGEGFQNRSLVLTSGDLVGKRNTRWETFLFIF